MKLTINGTVTDIEDSLTMSDLLARHKLKAETVVVEYNLRVPQKSEYGSIQLRDGDRIEIVKFMGGG
jgi:sulfur carrier protein